MYIFISRAKSWTVERDKPMHWESGFLRFNNDKKTASLVVAHNFGECLKATAM